MVGCRYNAALGADIVFSHGAHATDIRVSIKFRSQYGGETGVSGFVAAVFILVMFCEMMPNAELCVSIPREGAANAPYIAMIFDPPYCQITD